MNTKEVLLMAGTGFISFGMTLLSSDVWMAIVVVGVGCAILGYRGWLKSE